MSSASGLRWILCAAVLGVIALAAMPAQAQACNALSCWVVSLGCHGPFDTGRTTCVGGRCVCEVSCNNNGDCPAGQFCSQGRCADALLPCNNNTDCPSGFGCAGGTGVCAACGSPGVTCGVPDPCLGKKCDDGNACNGQKGCLNGNCFDSAPPPDCDDHDASTTDVCVATDALNNFRCDHYSPSKCSHRPGTGGDLNLTPIRSNKRVGFTWSGKIGADLSSEPAGVRFLVSTGEGAPLIDEQIGKGGAWKKRSGTWTWTAGDAQSHVRKVTLEKGGAVRIEGSTDAASLDMGRIDRPTGAVLIDFVAPDSVDICSGIPVPVCIPGDGGLRCRTEKIGGPGR